MLIIIILFLLLDIFARFFTHFGFIIFCTQLYFFFKLIIKKNKNYNVYTEKTIMYFISKKFERVCVCVWGGRGEIYVC